MGTYYLPWTWSLRRCSVAMPLRDIAALVLAVCVVASRCVVSLHMFGSVHFVVKRSVILQGLPRLQMSLTTTSSSSNNSGSTMRLLSKEVMYQLLQRVKENNAINDLANTSKFIPFLFNGVTYGYVNSQFVNTLSTFKDTFTTDHRVLRLVPSLERGSMQDRTKSVASVTTSLRDMGIIKGWRDELLPVVSSYDSEPIFLLERAAYPLFSTRGYGIHLNGYVRREVGEYDLWVAKRSRNKQTWPGMLDHIVAGGLPHGINLRDNVIKE